MTTFNYFYEGQEDQYSFFRIPSARFRSLSPFPCAVREELADAVRARLRLGAKCLLMQAWQPPGTLPSQKLMTEPCFKKLMLESKMLYGLMLDRLALSRKNHWVDNHGRIYIIYTVEQIMEDLNCSRPSAMNALNALDDKKGVGLIRRVRRGLGLQCFRVPLVGTGKRDWRNV